MGGRQMIVDRLVVSAARGPRLQPWVQMPGGLAGFIRQAILWCDERLTIVRGNVRSQEPASSVRSSRRAPSCISRSRSPWLQPWVAQMISVPGKPVVLAAPSIHSPRRKPWAKTPRGLGEFFVWPAARSGDRWGALHAGADSRGRPSYARFAKALRLFHTWGLRAPCRTVQTPEPTVRPWRPASVR